MKQTSIRKEITLNGIGQHKGTENNITLTPAPINSGIIFKIKGKDYKLNLENVFGTGGYTSIGVQDGTNVKTIEHLISTLHGLGIDNLIIETDSEEIPIQDGSSLPILEKLEDIGIIEQDAPKKAIKILKKVEYNDDKGEVSIEPSEKGLILDVSIDYTGIKPIGKQHINIELTPANYKTIIAPARTFARLQDVEYLHSQGLCLGATLKSGIAVDEERVLNPEGLRSPTEFVAHKVLDAVGDLYVMGHTIIGLYTSNKGGHSHNNQLVKKVMSDKSNYEIVEI